MKKFRSKQFARVIILSFSSCLFACQKDKPDLPVVTTAIITEISNISAVSGGNVTSIGGASVTARGICWNTSSNPSIKNSHTTESGNMGTFTCNLTQLSPSTQYFVRAYATNSGGTAYGDELTLKTYHGTLTDIDGNVYYDVAIGNQIWMGKNLKTTRYSDGTPIPYANSQVLLNAITSASKAYCWYNLDIGNKDVYGALYTWPAAMNGGATSSETVPSGIQGACPTGWHLPSDAEWSVLVMSLDPAATLDNQTSAMAGIKLNEAGSSHWENQNSSATNESNFTGLPGGVGYINFVGLGALGAWWSTTKYDARTVYYRTLESNNIIYKYTTGPELAMSVRCLKN